MPGPNLRVINDPPLSGAVNMARDEALLQRVGRGKSPPTMRFYQWDPPTISLGYFQNYADYEKLAPPAGDLAVVRRLTGGGAILHDRELTYSVTLPSDHPILECCPNRLYELAHDALIHALHHDKVPAHRDGSSDGSSAARGPFFCFDRRHKLDVLVGTDKLAGSAQRRTQQAVLQHGSIILEQRFEQQPAAALYPASAITADQLSQRMTQALAALIDLNPVPGRWDPKELADADQLAGKYAGDHWTRRC
jgi:lipoate-protein ligase A